MFRGRIYICFVHNPSAFRAHIKPEGKTMLIAGSGEEAHQRVYLRHFPPLPLLSTDRTENTVHGVTEGTGLLMRYKVMMEKIQE